MGDKAGAEVNPQEPGVLDRPWPQLVVGVAAMVAIANLQYGWTLFVAPLHHKFGWSEARIQVAFTLFVLAETWLVPVEGYLVDVLGPRRMVLLGGVLVGLAWGINAGASSLAVLYTAGILGGAGAGIVYGTSIGNALKWFPQRRGLAAGITAAAFGAGSALTVAPISWVIDSHGYESAFLWFGLGQGVVVLVCALLLRVPPGVAALPASEGQCVDLSAGRDYTWREMTASPLFWLMYLIMTMATVGGMMATAQLGPMARDYGVAKVPVSLLGVTAAALPFAMMLDRVLNGLTRPFFGWVSDHLGRENTMFIAFGLEAAAILLLLKLAHVPVLFVLMTGLTFFAWGEIYSLFPALCGDLFGRRFATINYGLLYTAKGTATLLVPVGSLLKDMTGSWVSIFLLAAALDVAAALLALLLLKPLAARWRSEKNNGTGGGAYPSGLAAIMRR